MYRMDCAIKSFAVANEFVTTMNKICYKLGKTLKPFSFYSDEFQQKYGVIDLTKFGGMVDSTVTLVDDVSRQRNEEFGIIKKPYDALTEQDKKVLFYNFLMSVSICYCEVEKWKTTNGVATKTFDKFLCTRNPSIIAAWMGLERSEMQAKYSRKIASDAYELGNGIVRYVKLNTSAKGNSVTVPRNFYPVEGMRCVPLFMLHAWVTGCKEVLNENIVKFTFLKDNHTERELCSTLSEKIIRKYYSDNTFISTMLSGIDIDQTQQGGMYMSSKMGRGYIKLPELGSSVYDSSGTRSLNIARVLKAEIVNDIDTTFINVSLSSVLDNFNNSIDYCVLKMPAEVYKIYNKLTGSETCDSSANPVATTDAMKKYVSEKEMLLSTNFQRYLHLFMVENPQWFPTYTGRPLQGVTTPTGNFGVEQMDF